MKSMFPAIGHRAALSERAALIASRGNAEERRMVVKLDASKSGSFKIGGDIGIHRLGFGAMRIAGPRVWGPPLDKAQVIRTLKRLPELGIDFVDTADSYGPDVSEQLIREALHPYDGMLIATKAGLRRPGPGSWDRDGRPEYLRQQAIKSRERLGLEQIGLWQLHSIDPKVPRDEQLAAAKSLLDDGNHTSRRVKQRVRR